ncbi:MAG: class I SAM-dependent rRNA methyltransferase, partial [Chloroflexota bacterium]
MTEGVIVLKQGKEKPVENKHPWVFSGAIRFVDNDPEPGDIVQVVNSKGDFLARGYFNPTSQIRVRILTWEDEPIDEGWWRRRLRRAIGGRVQLQEAYGDGVQNAARLVNAESDYIPGLVVDRYGDWLVMQSLTLGIDVRKHEIAEILADMLKPEGIYERSDVDIRQKEGLSDEVGVLWGEEPPDYVEIEENTLRFPIDVRNGHKTGFYLDQRDNRGWLHDILYFEGDIQEEDTRRVLNVFSYTGGFGLYALAAGVSEVVNVDSSQPALDIARATIEENGYPLENTKFVCDDAFEVLRRFAADGAQFDAVILDPPKFAQSKRQIDNATRGYKDLNLHAFKII